MRVQFWSKGCRRLKRESLGFFCCCFFGPISINYSTEQIFDSKAVTARRFLLRAKYDQESSFYYSQTHTHTHTHTHTRTHTHSLSLSVDSPPSYTHTHTHTHKHTSPPSPPLTHVLPYPTPARTPTYEPHRRAVQTNGIGAAKSHPTKDGGRERARLKRWNPVYKHGHLITRNEGRRQPFADVSLSLSLCLTQSGPLQRTITLNVASLAAQVFELPRNEKTIEVIHFGMQELARWWNWHVVRTNVICCCCCCWLQPGCVFEAALLVTSSL